MKKLLLLLLPLILFGCASTSKADKAVTTDDYYEQFWELWDAKKEDEAAALLETWQKENEKDPELYVCYFNMYMQKGSQEIMHLEPTLPANYSGQYMTGRNDDGEPIYLYSGVEYDDENCDKAIEYIDKGLSYNPKRLDMHFGKAHLLFLRQQYENQVQVIKNVFELNKKYKNEWLWTKNESIEALGVGFGESIHEYILKWYNTGDSSTFKYMQEVSILYADNFPEDPIAFNDAGISSMLIGDLKTARIYFEKGYNLNPSDMLILSNLARACYNLGETEASKKYYEIMAACDDPDYNEYAKEILAEYF